MRKLFPVMMAIVVAASYSLAADKPLSNDRTRPLEMGFSHVFDKKFYERRSFGLVVIGTTVVAASAFSYFTAGAGAPTAASGVSTVASWVGGGGAGSYMAGLSTIGGAFGGNAMVGAAILNGISIATVGGGSTFATLSATQKALAITSVSATMLDGVAIINGPETKALNYRIALPIPNNIGSHDLRQQADKLRKLGEDERKLGKKLDELADRLKAKEAEKSPENGGSPKKYAEAESKLRETKEMRAQLEREIASRARGATKKQESPEDIVLLAVLAKNLGKSSLFADLIGNLSIDTSKDSGYVNYLKAVEKIERNEVDAANALLKQSSIHNPYAIEQPILRVNILGHQGFDANKGEIIDIVSRTEKLFNDEKYATPFSLVSLYYRVGTLALINKDYSLAEAQFKKALDSRSLWEKYVQNDEFDSMIKAGLASAVFGQGRKDDAFAIIEKLLKKAKTGQAREVICAQFMGHCV